MSIEVRIKNVPSFMEVGQIYSELNKEFGICINGSVTVKGDIPGHLKDSYVKMNVNLCDNKGRILYVYNNYNSVDISRNNYFVFSIDRSDITRHVDIEEFEYVEVYAIFEKDSDDDY